ncbi:expressed unknown protein [Seminavis robusta]|uniref:Uncharacterized protein n=1 Tax=Seminavis robusta TaxID=568900 RepID=A0A9N8H4J2_9STRA|nr:expressed unknown protein [Seminavis robusta]|eukprot:Sro85_g045370.1 n/a (434) ;mRNA; f:66655-67956
MANNTCQSRTATLGSKTRLSCFLLLAVTPTAAFQVPWNLPSKSSWTLTSIPRSLRDDSWIHQKLSATAKRKRSRFVLGNQSGIRGFVARSTSVCRQAGANSEDTPTATSRPRALVDRLCLTSGIGSMVAWICLAIVALRFHPDPKFSHCSMKHNLLTMSQAFAFPLPVLASSLWAASSGSANSESRRSNFEENTQRRLCLGLTVTFTYLLAATAWAPAFACGYDLYPTPLKTAASLVFALAAVFHGTAWKKSLDKGTRTTNSLSSCINHMVRGTHQALWSMAPNDSNNNTTSALYSSATIGLLWFTVLPLVSDYPLLTIPTILGKRLSRAAGAFTWMGAVMAYSLRQASDEVPAQETDSPCQACLRKGLGIASALHVGLIALKLIGVDDGGFLLPGRGLWEVYPAMLAVPFATTASILTHLTVCWAAFTRGYK